MLPVCLEAQPDGVILKIRVNPRASRTQPEGLLQGRLRLRVQAPPVDGKANEAVLLWARKFFDLRASQVTLVRGDKSREKDLLLTGIDGEAAAGLLAGWIE